jgi:hypothetical protein
MVRSPFSLGTDPGDPVLDEGEKGGGNLKSV